MSNTRVPSAVPTDSLRDKVILGAAWMVGLRLCDRLFGLLSMFVLARLLLPADFGLVALVNALIGPNPARLVRHRLAQRLHAAAAILRGEGDGEARVNRHSPRVRDSRPAYASAC